MNGGLCPHPIPIIVINTGRVRLPFFMLGDNCYEDFRFRLRTLGQLYRVVP